jgi:cyclophilin family peptidyl-prolyl cis-trans isomerase/HEAT repeat protein
MLFRRHFAHMKSPVGLTATALAATLVLAACGPGAIPDEPVGEISAPPTRPPDGLLDNPTLQELVDLQVARDGASLTGFLRSEDPVVRARAAYALASVQDPEAGSTLTALLSDSEAEVRRDAAFAVGQLYDPIYGAAILGALRDETDPAVRDALLEALGKAGDARVLESLLGLDLPDEEEAARNLAIARMGLNGITLPTSMSYLISALENQTGEAQVNAAYYFGRNSDASPWIGHSNSVRAVLDSLPPSDPAAMQLLLGLSALGDQGDNLRFLTWLKGSPDWRIRANAARGLTGRTNDLRVREGLMDALEEPSTHVALSAANVLASVQQLPAKERDDLMSWVDKNPRDWRRVGPILAALGRMGQGQFLEDWIGIWGEEDVLPKTRGIGAMAFVPSPEATRYLMEAASSSQPRIRGTALGVLSRRWRAEKKDTGTVAEYFRVFSDGLRTGDPSTIFVSAPALADSAFLALGSLDLLMAEYEKLQLPDGLEGKQAILRSIGATGALEAEEFLRSASMETNEGLRAAGVDALAQLTGQEVEVAVEAEESGRTVDWAALRALGPMPRLILETEKGTVTLVLDTESAPLTVQTIAGFAQEGLYDDTPFHRVVPNFVVQGGDFAREDGFGGPGFSIRSEFTRIPYARGVLGMASSGKDTEGSQFFITHSMARHLDGGYTAFGWVESGMDVVDILYEENRILTARVEPGGS